MLSRAMFLRMTGVSGVVSVMGAVPASAQALPQPTKAEMLEAIQKAMNETYLSENGKSIWGNTAISISTTEPKIGQAGPAGVAGAARRLGHGDQHQERHQDHHVGRQAGQRLVLPQELIRRVGLQTRHRVS